MIENLSLTGRPWLSIEEKDGGVLVKTGVDSATHMHFGMEYSKAIGFDEAIADIFPMVEAEWPNRVEDRGSNLGQWVRWDSCDEIRLTIEATVKENLACLT